MDELVENLRKLVPAALKQFDTDSIHQARVATRRLKAAIMLLEPVLSDEHRKPFAKAGRQLRRRLGPLRDLDVMIEHLQKIQRRATHRTAAAWLEKRLVESRELAREDSNADDSAAQVLGRMGSWWGVREDVIDSGDQARSLLASNLHLQLDAFAEQANLLLNKDSAVKQDPHQVRIAGKALRYTLEMAKCEGHPIPGGVAKAFKRMQDSLGSWHDFVVLTERAMHQSLQDLLAHHDTQLQKQLLDLARWTLDNARKELERFSALWMQEGTELIKTIRDAVPLALPIATADSFDPILTVVTPPATEAPKPAPQQPEVIKPKTDPDLPGSGEDADSAPVPASDPAAA
jgi:CHAD domain-containing protein